MRRPRGTGLLGGHGDLVFGLIAAAMMGLSTAAWAGGQGTPPDPLPRTSFLVVHGLATVVVVIGIGVGLLRGRVRRRVVIATGWALGAVMVWQVLTLLNDADLLVLFPLIWTAMFTACLLTRTPARSGTDGPRQVTRG